MRISLELKSILAVVMLVAACGDDPAAASSTAGTGGAAGTSAGTGGTGAGMGGTSAGTGGTGAGGTTAGTGGAAGTTSPGNCTLTGEAIRYCEGASVVLEDVCGERTVIGTCPVGTACEEGSCFSFVPDAGRICDFFTGDAASVNSDGAYDNGPGEDCGTGYCQAGECVAPGCTPAASKTCFDGDVYYADSCGNRGYMFDRCANGCTNGVCDGCANVDGCDSCITVTLGQTCFNGGVRLITDDCVNDGTYSIEGTATPCEFGCLEGFCQPQGTCIPRAGSVCMGDNRMTVDSCGKVGAVAEVCADGCREGECIQCDQIATSCVDGKQQSTDAACLALHQPVTCDYGCDAPSGQCTKLADLGDTCECGDSFPSKCKLKSAAAVELGTCAGCWNGGDCFDAARCNAACSKELACDFDSATLTYTPAGGAAANVGTCIGCFVGPVGTCFSDDVCLATDCWQ